jgi:HEPN domain-containing protein
VILVDKVIGYLRRYFGRKASSSSQDSMNAHFFVRSGYEYYANARFAMHAQSSYVCGNLFHHAVEMLLKANLAKSGASLEELQRIGHNLKRLWRAYKRNHPNAALSRHDRTINRLDKHEDIRYPDPALGSIGVSMEWSGEPGAVTTYGGMKSPKQYAVVVSDIDDLVADIIRTSSWNPAAIVGANVAALEAIRRHNKHADFLTHGKIP